MLMSFAAAPQMALTQDIASLESRSTSHSSARAGDLRHRLRALQGQVDRAGRDATEARAAVLRLRADRDRAVMDAIAIAKAAAEAAVRASKVLLHPPWFLLLCFLSACRLRGPTPCVQQDLVHAPFFLLLCFISTCRLRGPCRAKH